jgi:polar amino acid transport system permease protein
MGWDDVWDGRELLQAGFINTISLTVASIITASLLGLAVALVRTARVRVLSPILRGYLEIFRGSPLLIQMLFIYFGAAFLVKDYEMPAIFANYLRDFSTYEAALVALTLYEGALISEIFRAGIEAVPPGQSEAGRSLGLSKYQVMRYLVLPQSFKVALAPLVGQYIGLVKDTSLAGAIIFGELVLQSGYVIARIGLPFHVYAVVALMYFVVCYPMSLAARLLEKKRGATA